MFLTFIFFFDKHISFLPEMFMAHRGRENAVMTASGFQSLHGMLHFAVSVQNLLPLLWNQLAEEPLLYSLSLK